MGELVGWRPDVCVFLRLVSSIPGDCCSCCSYVDLRSLYHIAATVSILRLFMADRIHDVNVIFNLWLQLTNLYGLLCIS